MGAGLTTRAAFFAATLTAATMAVVSASCSSDPVQANQIKVLGDEIPGIDPGEYHRAGQPCVTCHQEGGPGKGIFSIAGTVFFSPDKTIGVENVEVRLVDAQNATRVAKTNCVGNFFIGRDDVYGNVPAWNPAYPVLVTISKGPLEKEMRSLINRDGSCAGCHRVPAGLDSPGHVYLGAAGQEPPRPECPVSPLAPFDPGAK